jgi:hypothetical protein
MSINSATLLACLASSVASTVGHGYKYPRYLAIFAAAPRVVSTVQPVMKWHTGCFRVTAGPTASASTITLLLWVIHGLTREVSC